MDNTILNTTNWELVGHGKKITSNKMITIKMMPAIDGKRKFFLLAGLVVWRFDGDMDQTRFC